MSQDREYDVIVVGAGPGGATTATILAQKGYDVLLLDRATFPRDKICGDAVPTGAIRTLTRLGMGEKIQTAVDRGEFYPLTHMRLVSPKGKKLVAEFKDEEDGLTSYVAPRMFFDAVIKQQAVESGAEFLQAAAKEPIVENGSVKGVYAQANGHVEAFRSKMVVGADGVTSVITRALRPKDDQHIDHHRAVALRAYLKGIEIYPHEVEFYLYDDILPGYAWIFPTAEDTVNIGLGMRLDYFRANKKKLKNLLQQFLDMPDIKQRLKPGYELNDVATWQLNFGSQKHLQHTYNGAVLVGDAAGLINPLTGGGIHNSIISGELASETIDAALQANDTSREALKVYEDRVHEALWGSMKRSYFIQRWLLRFPAIVDVLIGRFQKNNALAQVFLTKL